ncbi:WXG100 family type VII secretion target [Glycomyces sp. L485]|uniref:WXG100 family type VII secretion target n=1 Tax=Glycomyces sp. L485 TaxID=2909235 RepID=UPI001F4B5932|nr:WXG100 family type VII secretion target [Glycomyces sp. L485]MCH7232975.1 WXG100 family type VII secretion target [Glycomyces sp. L485]
MGRIALSYEELESAYAQIQSQSGEMDGTLTDLRTQLDNMDWQGADKSAYEESKLQWDQAFEKINEILIGVGNAVNNAKQRYAETEAANAARFGA